MLGFQAENGAISEQVRSDLPGWKCGGSSAHVRVAENSPEGRKKRAGYLVRGPTSLKNMGSSLLSGSYSLKFRLDHPLNSRIAANPDASQTRYPKRPPGKPGRPEHITKFQGLSLVPQ